MTEPATWVIKIGSACLTRGGTGLAVDDIADWARQIGAMAAFGHRVLVVSSGSVAQGMAELGWETRPTELAQIQAAAAVGQLGVVRAWRDALAVHRLPAAQVLLSHDDVADSQRHANAQATLNALLELGVVPIVNENDTVATEELTLGDNDRLAAVVTRLVGAQNLLILTDQMGLMTADPRTNADAKLIEAAAVDDPLLGEAASGGRGALGRGGMRTKLEAARLAAEVGASTVIANGRLDHVITRAARGEPVGTALRPAGSQGR